MATTSSSSSNHSTSKLLTIPVELRVMIYRDVLARKSRFLYICTDKHLNQEPDNKDCAHVHYRRYLRTPRILLTCRQILNEIRPIHRTFGRRLTITHQFAVRDPFAGLNSGSWFASREISLVDALRTYHIPTTQIKELTIPCSFAGLIRQQLLGTEQALPHLKLLRFNRTNAFYFEHPCLMKSEVSIQDVHAQPSPQFRQRLMKDVERLSPTGKLNSSDIPDRFAKEIVCLVIVRFTSAEAVPDKSLDAEGELYDEVTTNVSRSVHIECYVTVPDLKLIRTRHIPAYRSTRKKLRGGASLGGDDIVRWKRARCIHCGYGVDGVAREFVQRASFYLQLS